MSKAKRIMIWLGVIGSIASLVSLAIYFVPISQQKDISRQDVKVGPSGIAGVSTGGNVNITVNPGKLEAYTFKQPPAFFGEIDYRDLASPSLGEGLVGKNVLFRATYLSEWNLLQVYSMVEIYTKKNVFINHRSIYYQATDNGFGGSNNEIPPFPLSITADQLSKIRKLKPGDFILIHGRVEKPPPGQGCSTLTNGGE